jgi:hypothetical protein
MIEGSLFHNEEYAAQLERESRDAKSAGSHSSFPKILIFEVEAVTQPDAQVATSTFR